MTNTFTTLHRWHKVRRHALKTAKALGDIAPTTFLVEISDLKNLAMLAEREIKHLEKGQ